MRNRSERLGTVTVAALVAAAAACGAGSDPGAEGVRTTTDTTGGVLRIHNAGAAPERSLEPLFAVGEQGGLDSASVEEFGRIRAVLIGSAGELYVADGQSARITVFDSAGGFVRIIGRRGPGPGEIERLQDAGWLADTLVVMDYENARLTRLTGAGEYVGEWPFMRASGTGVELHNAGVNELYSFAIRFGREGGSGRADPAWARFRTGGGADTIPRALPGESGRAEGSFELCRGEGGLSVYSNPVGETVLVRPVPEGLQVVARTSSYRVPFVGPRGDTTRILMRDASPAPLSDHEWAPLAADYDEWKATWRSARCEGSVTRPATKRLLLGLHYDDEGRLIVEYEDPGGPALDLYDHDHRWIARVPFIERDRSVDPAFRDGRVAVVRKDSLDIQRVEVFAIR